MKDLIERLEKATGPDRELDCMIWAEVQGYRAFYAGKRLLAERRESPHDTCWLGTIDPGKVARNFSVSQGFIPPIPFYTGSLDAAVALIPEGCAWQCGCEIDFTPTARVWGHDVHADDYGATPTIALCTVAIKAREAMSTDGRTEKTERGEA